MFAKAGALPEGVERLPIRTLHVNRSPVVIRNLKTLRPELAERWGLVTALHAPEDLADAALALASRIGSRGKAGAGPS